MSFTGLLVTVAVVISVVVGPVSARPPRYVLIEIGTFVEDIPFSDALAVNSAGEATGAARAFGTRADGTERLTIHAHRFTPEGGLVDIGDAAEIAAGFSRGWDINEAGVIAGEAVFPNIIVPAPPPRCTGPFPPPVIWRGNEVISLAIGEGVLGGVASAINSKDVVVGWLSLLDGSTGFQALRAFVWDGEVLRRVLPISGIPGRALDINDAGDIVGELSLNGHGVGFLIRDGEFINLRLASTIGISTAERINNAGQVFGRSHAGFYLWDDGETAVLEQTPRPSLLFDLNDHGDMVGGNGGQAFLWSEGKIYDLEDLINGGVPTGHFLFQARAISNRMHIVGTAVRDDAPITTQGFYLDPVTPDLTEDGVVGAADLARVLSKFGTDDPHTDLDGDGSINGFDLAIILNDWGPVPERDAHAAFLKYKAAEERRAAEGRAQAGGVASATPRAGARR